MDRFSVSYRVSQKEDKHTLVASTAREAATMTKCWLKSIDLNCDPHILSVEWLIDKGRETPTFRPKKCYSISYDGRDVCQ